MIYWGERPWRKSIGIVADRCFICWADRLHDIVRVNLTGHLFLLFRVGEGRTVAYEATCRECGFRRRAEPGDYAEIVDGPIDLPEAIARTNPSLPSRGSPDPRSLDVKERSQALQGTLRVLDADLRRHIVERRWSPLGRCVGWIGLILGLLIMGMMVLDEVLGLPMPPVAVFLVLSVVFVASLFAILYFVFTVVRWYVRHEIEPRLARALAVLQVTPGEFDELIARAREEELLLALRIRPGRVRRLMRRYRN